MGEGVREWVTVDEPRIVTLSWPEVHYGVGIGSRRQMFALQKNLQHANGLESSINDWSIHIEGACAEEAVAKYLNIFWSGSIGELLTPDVGKFQVRSTPLAHGRLIVQKKDPDDAVFILATGTIPRFIIVGWMYGHEAKRGEWWCDPQGTNRHAYFVPQSALHLDVERFKHP